MYFVYSNSRQFLLLMLIRELTLYLQFVNEYAYNLFSFSQGQGHQFILRILALVFTYSNVKMKYFHVSALYFAFYKVLRKPGSSWFALRLLVWSYWFHSWFWFQFQNDRPMTMLSLKQAGAELGQAQLKLRLDFTLIKIYYMKNLRN